MRWNDLSTRNRVACCALAVDRGAEGERREANSAPGEARLAGG